MISELEDFLQQPILILQIVGVVLGAFVVVVVFNKLISRLEKRGDLKKGKLVQLKRFFQILIYLLAGTVLLSMFEIDLTGVFAGLGIGALIIGFGLNEIIENWVSGILIISGKTFTIGDVIKVGDFTGTVMDISLRTTKLKTYDRNDVIIPNSVLIKERIINLTSGGSESVSSLVFSLDYLSNLGSAKEIIQKILNENENVIVNSKKRREVRFILRNKEWTNDLEVLFWIKNPAQEEFIKSKISELVLVKFKQEKIYPTIPALMRKESLTGKQTVNDNEVFEN
jgi:small conductance mechanosensitive channel